MFEQFIGNDAAKNMIRIGILSSIKKHDRLPNWMFSGMAGSGKTTLAKMAAEEANALVAYINASTIDKPDNIIKTLEKSFETYNKDNKYNRIMVIVDEAHALKKKVEDFLLTAISEDEICVNERGEITSYKIQNNTTGKNDFLSWVFVSNRCGELAQALRSRLTEVQFVTYKEEDKQEIAGNYVDSLDMKIEEEAEAAISKRAWSIRDVKQYINEVRDYAIVNDKTIITKELVEEYFDIVGIDKNGLGALEHEYLKIVADTGNRASVQTIASKLSVGTKDVTEVIEPRLLDLGIIGIDSGGRYIKDTSNMNPFVARNSK